MSASNLFAPNVDIVCAGNFLVGSNLTAISAGTASTLTVPQTVNGIIAFASIASPYTLTIPSFVLMSAFFEKYENTSFTFKISNGSSGTVTVSIPSGYLAIQTNSIIAAGTVQTFTLTSVGASIYVTN